MSKVKFTAGSDMKTGSSPYLQSHLFIPVYNYTDWWFVIVTNYSSNYFFFCHVNISGFCWYIWQQFCGCLWFRHPFVVIDRWGAVGVITCGYVAAVIDMWVDHKIW